MVRPLWKTAGDASEIKHRTNTVQLSHFWAFILKNPDQSLQEMLALQWPLQDYSQPRVHQQMNKGRTWEADFRSILKSPAFRKKEPCHVQPNAQRTLAGP